MSPRRATRSTSPAPRAPRRLPFGLWLGLVGVPMVASAASGEPSREGVARPAPTMSAAPASAPTNNDPAKAPPAIGADTSTLARSSAPPLPAEYVTEDQGWLHLGYHPSARDRLRVVMPRLDEMRNELRESLGADVLQDVELRVAALEGEMVRLTPGEVAPPAAGETFVSQHLVVLSVGARPGGDPQDLEQAIRYQLARLALAEAVSKPSSVDTNAGGAGPSLHAHRDAAQVPAWFEDGFATHFAKSHEASRAESLLFAWVRDDLPHVSVLGRVGDRTQNDRDTAFAADFVRFVSDSRERAALPEVVEKLRRGAALDDAIAEALGADRAGVDRAWRKDMARRYALFPVLALSLVLWAALWLVGLVRRKRAIAASESTAARLRALRRGRASDAGPLIVVSRARLDTDDVIKRDRTFADGAVAADALADGALADGMLHDLSRRERQERERPSRDSLMPDRELGDGRAPDGRLGDGARAERSRGEGPRDDDGRARDGGTEDGAARGADDRSEAALRRSERLRAKEEAAAREAEVPKIEHDGDWHTLH